MIVVQHSKGSYPVRFWSPEAIFETANHATSFSITDANLANLWLRGKIPEERLIVVPAGESSKSIEVFGAIQSELSRRGANRASTILAIGGGVIGDLAGFAAATFMRGVRLIQVPTSLLAMVDSSVGGKVGIDLPEGKNLVGAFLAPKEVLIAIEFLSTLPERQLRNGLAEVVKYGFIHSPVILDRTFDEMIALETVAECVRIKAEVVEEDEFETRGRRAILNFGHTIGHAIESCLDYQDLLHGEAIAIGMVLEARLGEALGETTLGASNRVAEVVEKIGLRTSHDVLNDSEALISAMRKDKKRMGDGLSFSLLGDVGTCKLVHGVSEEAVRDVLNSG